MLLSFIRKLFRRVSAHRSTTLQFRPGLESLDARTLPSTTGLGAVPTPAINGSAEAITAIAPNDMWAVGSYIPASSNTAQPLAEHFNGTSWSVVPTPANANGQLLAVSAVSSNNVWAVGSNGSTNTALIEHWNGTSWSIVPTPAQPGTGWLNSVTAISANDVWAVGFAAGHNLIEHFNGTSWSVVSAPAPRNSDLFSVSGTSSNDVWAVGESGRSDSRVEILHWNGSTWSAVSAPNATPFGNTLKSVTAISANDAWAVGFSAGQSIIEHWDGTSWSLVSSPAPPAGFGGVFLNGVSAISANNAWAVGYASSSNGTVEAVTEHWDGTSWSIVPTTTPQNQILLAVTTLPTGQVAAVGTGNTILEN